MVGDAKDRESKCFARKGVRRWREGEGVGAGVCLD
jgi:hypothetical protein